MHENGLCTVCGILGALPDGAGDARAVPTTAAFLAVRPRPPRLGTWCFLLWSLASVGDGLQPRGLAEPADSCYAVHAYLQLLEGWRFLGYLGWCVPRGWHVGCWIWVWSYLQWCAVVCGVSSQLCFRGFDLLPVCTGFRPSSTSVQRGGVTSGPSRGGPPHSALRICSCMHAQLCTLSHDNTCTIAPTQGSKFDSWHMQLVW